MHYERVSIISGTGAAICAEFVVVRWNGTGWYYHILGVSTQNFTKLGGRADFLRPFVFNCVSGFMWFRDRLDKGSALHFSGNLGKSATETLEIIRQVFRGENVNRTRKARTYWDRKNETGEDESQEHDHNFLWHRGDFSQRIHPGRPNS
jgi:hypothetical protein